MRVVQHDSIKMALFFFSWFADISDIKSLSRYSWTTAGPIWRKAEDGLFIEGICTSSNCKANGEMVIHMHGFTGESGFVLEKDAATTKCPLCREFVRPTTCGFNNCEWAVQGKIWLGLSVPPQPIHVTLTKADDAYWVFDGDNKVKWLTLKIIALPNGQGSKSTIRYGVIESFDTARSLSPSGQPRSCSLAVRNMAKIKRVTQRTKKVEDDVTEIKEKLDHVMRLFPSSSSEQHNQETIESSVDNRQLGNNDHRDIAEYLYGLDKKRVYNLGMELGLNHAKLIQKKDSDFFLADVIDGWLRREDQVDRVGLPSWATLVKALRHPKLGQNGIANAISRDHPADLFW